MTRERLQVLAALTACVCIAPSAAAGAEHPTPLRTVRVATVPVLREALDDARPGDLILVADAVYRTSEPLALRRSGSSEHPIVIRAAHRGKAIITGRAGFLLQEADHAVVEGFVFEGAIGTAVKLYGCSHARVTRNHIRLREPVNGPKLDWVISKYDGERNRIDHNLFEEKRAHGRFAYIHHHRRHDRIDHNQFRDHSPEGDNGKESIVIRGYFTTVEYNLFENCSGEGEIISVKSIYPERPSGDEPLVVNTFRYNTFLDSTGTLCLRQANGCLVEGNCFIARGGPGFTGGVKVYGDDHVIVNNYFEALTGHGHFAPFVLMHGDADIDYDIAPERYYEGMPSEVTMFPRPNRVRIEHNTWVNCSAVELGWETDTDRPLATRDCVFANNVIAGDRGRLVKVMPGQIDLRLSGNIVHVDEEAETGVSGFPASEFRVAEPGAYPAMGRQRLPFIPPITVPSITPAGGTFTGSVTVTLALEAERAEVRYTLDDTWPTLSSKRYRGPFMVNESITVRARAFFGDGEAGFENKASLTIMRPRPADEPTAVVNGLEYEYYEDREKQWWSLPDFDALKPVRSGAVSDFGIEVAQGSEHFAIRFIGFISIPRDGVYTFSKRSNGGCQLYIGAMLVLDNDGLYPHSGGWGRRGSVALRAGKHRMTLLSFERDYPRRLELHYAGPGIERQRVPASALYRTARADE